MVWQIHIFVSVGNRNSDKKNKNENEGFLGEQLFRTGTQADAP